MDATDSPLSLPLFPLQTVLFPCTVLPLQIFEVRYLDMVGRAYRDGTPFGIISLQQGPEVQRPASTPGAGFADERFVDVGTLVRVTHLEKPQPGLLLVRCEGTQRFRLLSRERLKHGLWMGQAVLLPADPPMAVPEDLHRTRDTLAALIRHVEGEVADRAARPFSWPYQLDDCGWLANTWCGLLPVPAPLKQRLLETDSPLLRLELVSDLLERIKPGT